MGRLLLVPIECEIDAYIFLRARRLRSASASLHTVPSRNGEGFFSSFLFHAPEEVFTVDNVNRLPWDLHYCPGLVSRDGVCGASKRVHADLCSFGSGE